MCVPTDPDLTIREAADALGVSVETLRRWADAGRLRVARTPGGHRRFPVPEVQRLLAEPSGRTSRSYKLDPPTRPLLRLAGLLEDEGSALLSRASRRLYAKGRRGWFAPGPGAQRAERWLEAVSDAALSGDYHAARNATLELARQAQIAAVSVLECDSFLELFETVVASALTKEAPGDVAAARRLLIVLRQSVLDEYHGEGSEPSPQSARPRASRDVDLAGGDEPLRRVLGQLISLYDVEEGAIFVTEANGLHLRLAAAASGAGESAVRPPERIGLGEGRLGRVVLERRPQLLRVPADWDTTNGAAPASRAIAIAPLLDGGQLIGAICLGTRPSRPVEEHELQLLGVLAERIGLIVAGQNGEAESLDQALARFRAAWSSSVS
jgi:excisionase family DNA binding protein